ncbi:DUF2064 domain-containing protein [archaeon]|jgi:glycosyltransferase A (GT-A) superfamily protein (DUF2064 family)|nr:DUF2064 domain-containing protein [archaeon]MBT6698543.1 DUF2064 domain-containing protein [archaeon]
MEKKVDDSSLDKKACVLFFCEHHSTSLVCAALVDGLGKEVGETAYKRLCEAQAEVLRSSGYPVIVCFKGDSNKSLMMKWLGPKYQYHVLGDDDFAVSLENVLYFAFSKGYHYVCSVFELMPQLKNSILLEAFRLLDEFDTVLGSSSQGRVGLFAVYRPSFKLSMVQGVDFNSEFSHVKVWENIRKADLSVEMLNEMLAVRNHYDYEALSVLPMQSEEPLEAKESKDESVVEIKAEEPEVSVVIESKDSEKSCGFLESKDVESKNVSEKSDVVETKGSNDASGEEE